MKLFEEVGLIEPLQRAVADANYQEMTPIQAEAIPPLLKGKDLVGCAQTGTGKTAAFLLPILHQLIESPRPKNWGIRALILSPTRELAAQIGESVALYSKYIRLSHHVIFGGVSQKPQVEAIQRGLDVVVATPGRLLDLKRQQMIELNRVEFFVLDEADCMLDMGFIHDIKKVFALLPRKRQTLLFSATMPAPITNLAQTFLKSPVRIEVAPQSTTAEKIEQTVMFVDRPHKRRLLAHLLADSDVESAIVFTRTKHGANRVVKDLGKVGIEALAIHGNKSQNARLRALDAFKSRQIHILVATDIAARGIDVSGVSHVFNYDLPNVSETYVHRIGRTARAGRAGVAIAFCDESESTYLQDIESLIGQSIRVNEEHEWHYPEAIPAPRIRGRRQQRRKKNSKTRQNQDAVHSSSNQRGQTQHKKRTQKKKRPSSTSKTSTPTDSTQGTSQRNQSKRSNRSSEPNQNSSRNRSQNPTQRRRTRPKKTESHPT